MKIKLFLIATLVSLSQGIALAKTPAELNDLELAHVAYSADNIDIQYAHLALAI